MTEATIYLAADNPVSVSIPDTHATIRRALGYLRSQGFTADPDHYPYAKRCPITASH